MAEIARLAPNLLSTGAWKDLLEELLPRAGGMDRGRIPRPDRPRESAGRVHRRLRGSSIRKRRPSACSVCAVTPVKSRALIDAGNLLRRNCWRVSRSTWARCSTRSEFVFAEHPPATRCTTRGNRRAKTERFGRLKAMADIRNWSFANSRGICKNREDGSDFGQFSSGANGVWSICSCQESSSFPRSCRTPWPSTATSSPTNASGDTSPSTSPA